MFLETAKTAQNSPFSVSNEPTAERFFIPQVHNCLITRIPAARRDGFPARPFSTATVESVQDFAGGMSFEADTSGSTRAVP